MSAPPVLVDVFRAWGAELGEEDTGIVFDGGPPPIERIDVLVYRATDPTGFTVFVTIGMSAAPMPSRPDRTGGGRAELRLHRRGPLSPDDEGEIAMRLANLASSPWTGGAPLGWGEVV